MVRTTGLRKLTPLISTFGRYALGLSARGIEVVAKFGLYALAARVLGGSASGIFFMCLTILHLTSTIARLGTDRPISRNVAAYLAGGQIDRAKSTILHGLAVATVMGLLVGLAIWLTAGWQADHLFRHPELAAPLRVFAFTVPVHVLAYACGAVLVGLDRGAAAQALTNAVAPALTLLALVVGVQSLIAALAIYAAIYAGCALAGLILIGWEWRRAKRDGPVVQTRSDLLPSVLAGGRQFYLMELIQAALLGAPLLVLARFADTAAVSQFSIANRLSMLIATIVLSIATMSSATFARHHRLGEHAQLARTLRQVSLVSMAVCFPLIAAMIMLRHPLLGFMNADVDPAPLALIIMAMGQLLVAALPARDTLLAMSGAGRPLTWLSLLQLSVAIAACAILIPSLGMLGAAITSAATWAVGVVGCALIVRRTMPELRNSFRS